MLGDRFAVACVVVLAIDTLLFAVMGFLFVVCSVAHPEQAQALAFAHSAKDRPVLGSLIPDAYVESTLCSGVWFDRAGASEWISTAEAADILGVGRIRVTQLINAGQIRAEKVGNRYNVDRASVEERAANPPKAGRRW